MQPRQRCRRVSSRTTPGLLSRYEEDLLRPWVQISRPSVRIGFSFLRYSILRDTSPVVITLGVLYSAVNKVAVFKRTFTEGGFQFGFETAAPRFNTESLEISNVSMDETTRRFKLILKDIHTLIIGARHPAFRSDELVQAQSPLTRSIVQSIRGPNEF